MTTTSYLEAAFAQTTAELFLILATVEGDNSDPSLPIYLVRDTVAVTSRGNTFNPFPFDVTVADSSGDAAPAAKFSISSVTQELIQALRLVSDPLDVTIEVIRKAAPNTVEVKWPTFQLRNVQWAGDTVSGDLTLDNPMAEPAGWLVFSPGFAPGVFAAQQ